MYYPRHKKCKIYQAYLHQSMWTAKKFKEHIVSSNLSRQKKKRIEVSDFILPFKADNKREGW